MKRSFYLYRFFVILTVLSVGLFCADSIKACTCFSPSLEGAIEGSDNVVIAKMQSAVKHSEDVRVNEIDPRIRQTNFTVEKVFKGKLKVGQTISFEQGGCCNCVLAFDENLLGEEFLFYLGDKPDEQNLWTANVCSRSNTVKGAAADLLYLENMAKMRGKTRLAGTLTQEDEPAVEGEKRSFKRLAGKTVTISGNGKNIKLKTDANGVYEIYELPPGKYKVTPEKLRGYLFNDDGKDSEEVEIEAESLTEQDFDFEIDNSISGRIFDADGRPLNDVCLTLLPARGKAARYFREFDCTERNGFFHFDEVPIGAYVIAVNEKNEITADSPFGTFYYPNKINRSEAAEINVGPGSHFKNLLATAPTTLETITVSGVLLYEDGTPVFDEFIKFYKDFEEISRIEKNKSPDSRSKTDKDGRFTIKILKGEKGFLFGSISTFAGDYENCPKLDALIRAKGKSVQDIETPAMPIKAENNLTVVEFKFPFPSCKKAKRE